MPPGFRPPEFAGGVDNLPPQAAEVTTAESGVGSMVNFWSCMEAWVACWRTPPKRKAFLVLQRDGIQRSEWLAKFGRP